MLKAKARALISSINNRDFLVVMLWSAVIAFVVSEIFWLKYTDVPRLASQHDIYTYYDAPAPGLLDLVVLAIASFVVTFLVSDIKALTYGFVATIFISFSVAVLYVFLFIWYIQGWGVYFSSGPFDWEVPLFFAILNVFRIVFPSILATCLLGALVGFLFRGMRF
jgi:hypothetical protein